MPIRPRTPSCRGRAGRRSAPRARRASHLRAASQTRRTRRHRRRRGARASPSPRRRGQRGCHPGRRARRDDGRGRAGGARRGRRRRACLVGVEVGASRVGQEGRLHSSRVEGLPVDCREPGMREDVRAVAVGSEPRGDVRVQQRAHERRCAVPERRREGQRRARQLAAEELERRHAKRVPVEGQAVRPPLQRLGRPSAPIACTQTRPRQGGGWRQGCGAAHMMRSFQTSEVRSSCASHSTAPIDRWFVGSSSSKRSGRANIAAASAARTRQPPDSAEHGRASSSGEKPRFCSSLVARSSTESAPISSRRSWTACGGGGRMVRNCAELRRIAPKDCAPAAARRRASPTPAAPPPPPSIDGARRRRR